MKAILNLFKRDLIRSFRDNILLYVIFSPILLGTAAFFIVPIVTNPQYNIIVESELQNDFDFSSLPYSKVEFVDSATINERVLESESLMGIIKNGSQIEITLSMSIAEEAESYLKENLVPFLNGKSIETTASSNSTTITGYTMVLLLMLTMVLGGMVIGLLIVEEKSGKTLLSTAISPVGIKKYIAAKSLISFSIPYLIGMLMNFIVIQTHWSLGVYTVASVSVIPLGILFGLVVGYVADNQISAMGIIKLLMPLFLTVPIVSMFVPVAFKWIFYIFPNYWMFETFKYIYLPEYMNDVGFIFSAGATLFLGTVILIIFLPKSAKRLGLK